MTSIMTALWMAFSGVLAGCAAMKMAPRQWTRGTVQTSEVQDSDKPQNTMELPGSPVIAKRLTVVVPARNEAKRLPNLLRALPADHPEIEVVVADDQSTDETANIAQQFGARVVRVPLLADGWQGKAFACWHGAVDAQTEWLAFVDADVVVEAGGLLGLIDPEGKGHACSVQPWHDVQSLPEQASAWFNALVWVGTRQHASDRYGGFGPCLVVSKSDYQAVGGHAAVASELLENSTLARVLAKSGVHVENMVGTRELRFRMHQDTWHSVASGWHKHFATGAAQAPRRKLALTVLWISGAGSAVSGAGQALFGRPHTGDSTELVVLAVVTLALYAAQIYVVFRRVGSFRWYTAVLYPLSLLFFLLVAGYALARLRRKRLWKGRAVSPLAKGGDKP